MKMPDPVRVFGGHDGGSGCSWYRIERPLAELARQDPRFKVTMADSGDRVTGVPMITPRDLEGHHVIVAQRWNTHKGLGIWRDAARYAKLVYELDDDVFSVTPENWNAFNLYRDPVIRDAVEHSIEVADLVTVSTGPLAEVMRQYNPNVVVLGNCIPGWVLDLPPGRHERPRIGWQGAASHGVDIGIIAAPVRRFLKQFPGWDFQVNGTDYRPTIAAPAKRMFYAGWTQVNDDPEGFYSGINFDIGLCPLAPSDFTRSKSAIKAIEYGGRGIPVIATDCPAYRAVVKHGENGFLVRQDHEWFGYLRELAGDDALREKMGAAAKAMAAEHLIENRWTEWRDAYASLFGVA